MPSYVVSRTSEFLNEFEKPIRGSKICLLGVAYKKDVDDPRESPSFELLNLLIERGAIVTYSDPHIPKLPKMRHHDLPEMQSAELTAAFLSEQDAIIIATGHSDVDYDFIVSNASLVIDTRNATHSVKEHRERIRKT